MKKKSNIIVFGASGRIGNELLKVLSENHIPAIAITRDKSKVVTLPHIKWAEGDMNSKESLLRIMTGVEIVFLLSNVNDRFVIEQNNVIDTANDLGAKHVVKLSSVMANAKSHLFIPKVHGEVEEQLSTSGLHYTLLRSTGMMQNWLGELASSVKKERKFFESTGDGKRAYIDIRDIAEVAFTVLTNPEKHIDKTYILTGGTALNYTEVAQAISNAIKEEVTYCPITLTEAREQMELQGLPDRLIKTFLAYDEAQARGEAVLVSPHVQEILNKTPRTIDDFIKNYIAWFK